MSDDFSSQNVASSPNQYSTGLDSSGGWLNTPLGYIAIIAVTAVVFAIGGVLEYEYGNGDDSELVVYSIILSLVFGVGIFVVMRGLSSITPPISPTTIWAIIGVNALIIIIIGIVEDENWFFAHSAVTALVTGFFDVGGTLKTNIWVVRVVQAGLFALIISELNTLFGAVGETRLNIGLTLVVFIGLIGASWGYVELMGGAASSSIFDEDEFRMKLAGSGAAYGAAVAGLLLFAYKMAHNAKTSTITLAPTE